MKRRPLLGYIAGCAVLLTAAPFIAAAVSSSNADDDGSMPERISSANEASAAALAYTNTRITIVSGSPEVVAARGIAGPGLQELGMGATHPDYSLTLVIMQGDFDIAGAWPGAGRFGGNTRYTHLNYVINNETGRPREIMADNGMVLQRLNDPSLRLPPPEVEPPVPMWGPPSSDEVIAPTVVTP